MTLLPVVAVGNNRSAIEVPYLVDPSKWIQSDWYVSWAYGNDNNDGSTPATPVKTVMGGVVAKWNTISPILEQNTTIHILDSQPLGGENIILTPIMVGAVYFAIVGTLQPVGPPIVLGAGSVTPKNRGIGQPLVVNGLPATFTAGTLAVNTTHPSRAFVDKNVAGAVTFSQPLTTVEPGNKAFGAGTEVDTWAAGDSIQLYEIPTINLISCVATGGAVNQASTASALWIYDLHILDVSGTPDTSCIAPSISGAYATLSEVWVEPYLLLGIGLPTFCNTFNCYLAGGGIGGQAAINGGIVTAGNTGFILDGGASIDQDVIVDGIIMAGEGSSLGLVYIGAGEISISDGSVYLAPLTGPTIVWGPGKIDVFAGGRLYLVDTTFVITLTGGLQLKLDHTLTTGTSYAAGVWTDGIALTPANIDANGGLQNPKTGSRYAPV